MSDAFILELIQKYSAHGLLVDTNLLLVFLIGQLDPKLIARFKRTQAFSPSEFRLLARFLAEFQKTYTTPNILTEINSLANQLPEKTRTDFLVLFRKQIELVAEQYVPSVQISSEPLFKKCGLTDAATVVIARQRLLVLTDDFRLCGYLESQRVDFVNFNHIRLLAD
jgi:hypothetical protein